MAEERGRRRALWCAAVLTVLVAVVPGSHASAGTWQAHGAHKAVFTTAEVQFYDATNHIGFDCDAATLKPIATAVTTWPEGNHVSADALGGLASLTFSSKCPLAVDSTDLPWKIKGLSYDRATKTVTLEVEGVHSLLSTRFPAGCTAILDGTGAGAHDGWVKMIYSDGTLQTEPNSNLHLFDVSRACNAVNTGLHDGEPMAILAEFYTNASLTITGP